MLAQNGVIDGLAVGKIGLDFDRLAAERLYFL